MRPDPTSHEKDDRNSKSRPGHDSSRWRELECVCRPPRRPKLKSSASVLAESIRLNISGEARMQFKPFLLDTWLDRYEHGIEFNLAASTGPTWTVNDVLALADD